MANQHDVMWARWRHLPLTVVTVIAAPLLLFRAPTARVQAQSPPGLAQPAQSTTAAPRTLPEIEAADIGLAFEVASVRPNRSGAVTSSSRFPLGPGDAFGPGDLFSAVNQPLIAYIRFAFKLNQTDLPGLPSWVHNDRFDISARAEGTPTKDQMRRMMQRLLADRFKLHTHVEQQTKRAFELMLVKPGQTGPQLQPHSGRNGTCAAAEPITSGRRPSGPPPPPSQKAGLQLPPFSCGSIGQIPSSGPGRGRTAGRDVPIARLAAYLTSPFTGIDRPIIDRTGLVGTFDFSVEWALADDLAQAPPTFPEDAGPAIAAALESQLGLTLKSTTAQVDVRVADHIEQPSPD
jgi:uncharacterized protein (TIGR03435 family)